MKCGASRARTGLFRRDGHLNKVRLYLRLAHRAGAGSMMASMSTSAAWWRNWVACWAHGRRRL